MPYPSLPPSPWRTGFALGAAAIAMWCLLLAPMLSIRPAAWTAHEDVCRATPGCSSATLTSEVGGPNKTLVWTVRFVLEQRAGRQTEQTVRARIAPFTAMPLQFIWPAGEAAPSGTARAEAAAESFGAAVAPTGSSRASAAGRRGLQARASQ